MKAGTIFVAVLFGPGARVSELFAPGDADCRWRAVATLEREAVNDVSVFPEGSAPAVGSGDGRRERS